MVIETEKHYEVTIAMSSEEVNRLMDELEDIFIDYVQKEQPEKILKLTEFKNLLMLSMNNAR